MGPLGPWALGPIWAHMGPFGPIWVHFGPILGPNWVQIGQKIRLSISSWGVLLVSTAVTAKWRKFVKREFPSTKPWKIRRIQNKTKWSSYHSPSRMSQEKHPLTFSGSTVAYTNHLAKHPTCKNEKSNFGKFMLIFKSSSIKCKIHNALLINKTFVKAENQKYFNEIWNFVFSVFMFHFDQIRFLQCLNFPFDLIRRFFPQILFSNMCSYAFSIILIFLNWISCEFFNIEPCQEKEGMV